MTESETARRSNELSCLVALRDAGELTITELMFATGLSRPTADGISRVLEEGGAIGSAIRPAQGAGRPARVYRFTADELTAGLEIGRSTVRAVVADRAGVVIDRREIPRREPTQTSNRPPPSSMTSRVLSTPSSATANWPGLGWRFRASSPSSASRSPGSCQP